MLQRSVYKFCHFSKSDDLIKLAIDFFLAHAQDSAVQIGIFAARQLRVKTGAHFEETAHAAMDFSPSNRGVRDPGENFQQSGFSSPIPADQTHHFALAQFERYVAQSPKIPFATGGSVAVWIQPANRRLHRMNKPLAQSRLEGK